MPLIPLPIDKGTATGLDVSNVRSGELQESEGVVYKPGDPAAHKIGGRALFASSGTSTAINGIKFVDFDSATDRLTIQTNGSLYSSTIAGAAFGSVRSGLTAAALHLDATKFADNYFMCNGIDTNWVMLNDNTTVRQGLTAITSPPTHTSAGTGITGTFIYWVTEYDSTNDVESAAAATGATLSVTVTDDTVTITKPTTLNSSATHWRLYRSKDGGAFPIGWLVASTAIGTTTYADSKTDAALVLLTPYPIVTLNGASFGRNHPAPVFRSLTTFEGSLAGVGTGRSLYWSETAVPHYFPVEYEMPFRPSYGGTTRCIRSIGRSLIVFFDNESFRVNFLPKELDATFDTGVAQERLCNFGTPSQNGAATFSGWGGTQMLFFASRQGPMLTDGNYVDRAVRAIDWANTVDLANLDRCVAIDNPDLWRVELYYPTSDTTLWRRLDFYYDPYRITSEGGFPELVWTGPHRTPGPGIYSTVSGVHRVYTGSRTVSGSVYQEDSGYSDAANLVDGSGTINCKIRTGRFYPDGLSGEATAKRVFVHKQSAGTGTYSVTVTAQRETAGTTAKTVTVDATAADSTSLGINLNGTGFDVRAQRNDTAAMPPINTIAIEVDDMSALEKT
jgi:hypothetical protein